MGKLTHQAVSVLPQEMVTKGLQGLLQGWSVHQCTSGGGHLILESLARELKVIHLMPRQSLGARSHLFVGH